MNISFKGSGITRIKWMRRSAKPETWGWYLVRYADGGISAQFYNNGGHWYSAYSPKFELTRDGQFKQWLNISGVTTKKLLFAFSNKPIFRPKKLEWIRNSKGELCACCAFGTYRIKRVKTYFSLKNSMQKISSVYTGEICAQEIAQRHFDDLFASCGEVQ